MKQLASTPYSVPLQLQLLPMAFSQKKLFPMAIRSHHAVVVGSKVQRPWKKWPTLHNRLILFVYKYTVVAKTACKGM
jgi:hypothetical protein